MSRSKSSRSAPFSLRLTRCERAYLEGRSDGMPLGTYIRSVLLDLNEGSQPSARIAQDFSNISEWQRLPQILAKLGTSEKSIGLREIARLAGSGALPWTPEIEAEVLRAALDIAEMKSLLMKALRTKER